MLASPRWRLRVWQLAGAMRYIQGQVLGVELPDTLLESSMRFDAELHDRMPVVLVP